MEEGGFQLVERGELLGVEGFEPLGFGGEGVELVRNALLFRQRKCGTVILRTRSETVFWAARWNRPSLAGNTAATAMR